jgi:hypothetical protein
VYNRSGTSEDVTILNVHLARRSGVRVNDLKHARIKGELKVNRAEAGHSSDGHIHRKWRVSQSDGCA